MRRFYLQTKLVFYGSKGNKLTNLEEIKMSEIYTESKLL